VGPALQADLTRLRILVVGVGSVGLDVAVRLAATGIQHLAVMDRDIVKHLNLDRLIGATRGDADLSRPKLDVAVRLMCSAATAENPDFVGHPVSVCDSAAHTIALDYDVVFSCVDKPWPRAVLNMLAYADLIPVIDGGIAIDAFDDGTGHA
jgi:molybdopterin-synthase adenylyltransferase